ncbi:hypothetical protein LR48_Vigan04g182800 [Vigna angularis]|uniref:Uncharacterized protein n=1 Tax=Phaseolus angularis TaxID=3914 RepID=A0A0L9UFE9_PHAAN|nr:hypothetical protein LR48_Vigan04g182800 [Vigna angularis]
MGKLTPETSSFSLLKLTLSLLRSSFRNHRSAPDAVSFNLDRTVSESEAETSSFSLLKLTLSLLRSSFRNHRSAPDAVSFNLDRTVSESEAEGETLLEDVIEEENLVDVEVKAEP